MIVKWKKLGRMAEIFYIVGLVSAIGLPVMILSGEVSIWDALTLKYT